MWTSFSDPQSPGTHFLSHIFVTPKFLQQTCLSRTTFTVNFDKQNCFFLDIFLCVAGRALYDTGLVFWGACGKNWFWRGLGQIGSAHGHRVAGTALRAICGPCSFARFCTSSQSELKQTFHQEKTQNRSRSDTAIACKLKINFFDRKTVELQFWEPNCLLDKKRSAEEKKKALRLFCKGESFFY